MTSRPTRPLALWGPPLVLMAVIFALSAMPSDSEHHSIVVFVLRKIAHFSEYALLLALWLRAVRSRMSLDPALMLAYALTVAYASSDEYHQTFVSGRVGTWRDVVIDATGALVVALVIRRLARRSRQPV